MDFFFLKKLEIFLIDKEDKKLCFFIGRSTAALQSDYQSHSSERKTEPVVVYFERNNHSTNMELHTMKQTTLGQCVIAKNITQTYPYFEAGGDTFLLRMGPGKTLGSQKTISVIVEETLMKAGSKTQTVRRELYGAG